jgi:HSP20 family protein
MSLVHWKPRDLETTFSWDPFFDRFFDLVKEGPAAGLNPALDLVEEKDRLIATVELPGVEPKNVEVNLQGDLLTIRGERKSESEEKKGSYLRREQSYGAFQRAVRLPYRVESSKVKASYENGILRIEMPKTDEVIGRRITVESK